jgi:isoquinoline 1-oxidoreductase beta subunit
MEILSTGQRLILSRRSFLATAGIITVSVAFGAPPPATADVGDDGFRPNAWVVIGHDDIVSIYFALAEMGQGIKTTLPLLIAEELDADWDKVHVLQSPSDGKVYGGPDGSIGTFGSTSTRTNFERLRLIGAQARRILLINAAKLWGVPVEELTTSPGAVAHAKTGRTISYGALAQIATVPDPLPVMTKTDLKRPADFRYIGKSLPRVDVPAKVNGAAVFGIDTQLPDMLYGAIARPPVQGEKPEAIDDEAARKIDGILKIVSLPSGVGVIGLTVEATQRAKRALRIKWSATAKARNYSSDRVIADFRSIAGNTASPSVAMSKKGDAPAAIAGAARTFSGVYTASHVAHFCMEPMNATVLVDGDKIDVWTSTQGPTAIQAAIAQAGGTTPDKVSVHSTLLGGGFGRRFEPDYAVDAYLLAREAVGRPVKLIFSREDDVQCDRYRPLVAQRIEAGLDAAGKIVGWRHRVVGDSYFARALPALAVKLAGKDGLVAGGGDLQYPVPNQLVEYVRQDRGIAVGALRGVSQGYTKFAVEGMIDEMATTLGADPLAFRLDLLKENPRAANVVRAVAEMADWTRKRPGRGLGLAYSDDLASFMAVVAEISIDEPTGEIRVHDIWCAFDAGIVVQPVNMAAQLEGSLLFGMSVALYEQLNVRDGAADESNFGEYRVLRMSDIPEVHLSILATDNPPSGVGEAGVPAIAPAIANAFAQLSGGKRLRHLPMLPEHVKTATVRDASL